jgi:hypothetical protein
LGATILPHTVRRLRHNARPSHMRIIAYSVYSNESLTTGKPRGTKMTMASRAMPKAPVKLEAHV